MRDRNEPHPRHPQFHRAISGIPTALTVDIELPLLVVLAIPMGTTRWSFLSTNLIFSHTPRNSTAQAACCSAPLSRQAANGRQSTSGHSERGTRGQRMGGSEESAPWGEAADSSLTPHLNPAPHAQNDGSFALKGDRADLDKTLRSSSRVLTGVDTGLMISIVDIAIIQRCLVNRR